MSIFEFANWHCLAVYDDEQIVHHKDADCRPVHEMDHDAAPEALDQLRDEGYRIHDCVLDNL